MPALMDLAPNSFGTPGTGDAGIVKTHKAQENFYLRSELHNFTWVVILKDGSSKVGTSRSASFQLPGCLEERLLMVGCIRMRQISLHFNVIFFTREWNLAKLTPPRSGDPKLKPKKLEPLVF